MKILNAFNEISNTYMYKQLFDREGKKSRFWQPFIDQ